MQIEARIKFNPCIFSQIDVMSAVFFYFFYSIGFWNGDQKGHLKVILQNNEFTVQ